MPHRKKTLRRLRPTEDRRQETDELGLPSPVPVALEMRERAERRSSAAAPSAEGLKLERTPGLADFTEEEGA